MLTEETRIAQFPTLRGVTYLNTAAEGLPPLVVGQALEQYFRDRQHGMKGRKAHFAQLELLKQHAAALLNLEPRDIGFCSCTSEAFNLARMALRLREGDEIIVNDMEFPSGVTPWLAPNSAATVKIWRAREGALRVEDLIPLLSTKTRLVPVSLVSFYNGFRIPLSSVVDTVRKHSRALLALDVTQALGRIMFDASNVDMIVSSTHKWILGSHGGGIVGIPKAAQEKWHVPAGGWFNVKDAFRPDRFDEAQTYPGAAGFAVGMPNFPAVYAVAAALRYITSIGVENIERAADPLVAACLEELSGLPVELLTPREKDARSGIVAFKHARFERINERLVANNVHVMSQAGRLRVSLHGYNIEEDVRKFISTLKEALAHA